MKIEKLSISLTFEQINDLRIAFSLLHKDNDGSISSQDLGSLLSSLGYKVTDHMIEEFNIIGNGRINFEEFLKLIADDCDFDDDETQLFDAFKLFDKDGNGFISAAELKHVMHNLGEKLSDEEIDEMIKEADADGDGQVSYEDFIKVITT